MRRLLRLFQLDKEERWLAILLLLFFIALTAIFLTHYYPHFSNFEYTHGNPFFRHFRVSGYDSFLYTITSRWSTYDTIIYRHPLLVFILWPLHVLNYWLYLATGINCVQFVIAVPLLFSAVYSAVFLFRIFRQLLGLGRWESYIFTTMTFSFAHVMIAVFVPDHFIISMFLLTLTLYVAGRCIKSKRELSTNETFWLTFLTGGITLTNGIKPIIAAFFVNGRKIFKKRFFLIGIVLPCMLLIGISNLTYKYITHPEEVARYERKMRIDSLLRMKYPDRKVVQKKPKKRIVEPISEQGFLKWSDMTTPRLKSVWHNLFGESIQLHEKDLLRDSQFGRELFTKYNHTYNYIVEILLVLLFLCGIWCGRKSRFLWLCLAWWVFDMVMHLGFGFALREIYLMTAHWAFTIPITIAFLLKSAGRWRKPLTVMVGSLTVFLYIYNVSLIISYFTC